MISIMTKKSSLYIIFSILLLLIVGTLYLTSDFYKQRAGFSKVPVENLISEATPLTENEVSLYEIAQAREINDDDLVLNSGNRMPDTYGNAFCLVSSVNFQFPNLVIDTYKTDVNTECTDKVLTTLESTSIKAQLTAVDTTKHVEVMGPNHRTMQNSITEPQFPFIYLGRFKVFPIGSIKIRITDLIRPSYLFTSGSYIRDIPYTVLYSKQNLHAMWNIGDILHTLISPDGKVFVMTSYSRQSLTNLNNRNLYKIGQFLDLPQGWEFKAFKLNRPLIIRFRDIDGFVTPRLIDGYGNVYIGIKTTEDTTVGPHSR